MSEARLLVIGCGNLFRGDDALGRLVARAWHDNASHDAHVETCECDGHATELLELWEGRDNVVVLDAMEDDGVGPGGLRHWRADTALPLVQFGGSTHSFDLPQAIELARVMGKLPRQLTIVGIAGVDFTYGDGLSQPVQACFDQILVAVRALAAKAFTTMLPVPLPAETICTNTA